MYGYCDGRFVYLNARAYNPDHHYFVRLETFGEYFFCVDSKPPVCLDEKGLAEAALILKMNPVPGVIPMPVRTRKASAKDVPRTFAINYYSGQIVPLTTKAMERILFEEDLYNEFLRRLQQDKPVSLQPELIEKYNKRHPVTDVN